MKNAWSGLMGMLILITAAGVRADIYVTTNGLDSRTGGSWDQSVATISNAVDKAGLAGTVWVSNGTYRVTAEILLTNGITVCSTGGRDETVVTGPTNNSRVFRVTHPDAVLDGFTITRGGLPGGDKKGGGLYLNAGLVRNCVISNNVMTNTAVQGAGVYMAGGTLSNSVIAKNGGATSQASQGAGVYITNGLLAGCTIHDNGNNVYVMGAGVCLTGNGVVSNCVIRNNTLDGQDSGGAMGGGGVWMSGGLLQQSLIISNFGGTASYNNGGGVRISGGRMEQCLVVSNACYGSYGGGGVSISGGTVVNCTISANRCALTTREVAPRLPTSEAGAGVQWRAGGTLTNVIVYGNTRLGSQAQINIAGAGYSNAFYSSCSPDLIAGSNGNLTVDPQFVDAKAGNFRLLPYSACVDAGAATGSGADRDGTPTPQDGRGTGLAKPDMGAFECPAADAVFNCYFQAPTNEAWSSLDARFTARVFGPNTNALYYWWDFGNGTMQGAGLDNVTRTYGSPGFHTVSLAVSNQAGQVTGWTLSNYIRVGGPFAYVATNGAHQAPFDTWSKAATSVLAAVNAAVVTPDGTTRVVVSNGTYSIPSSSASVLINRGITLSSLSGPSSTILWGTTNVDVYPDVDLDHPDAVVDGFTLASAHFGAMIHRGTVRNCMIRDNAGSMLRSGSGFGAGVKMFGGTVEFCTITNNRVGGNYTRGAGLFATGSSLVRNCTIQRNYASGGYASGAGVYLGESGQKAILRNCLVAFNTVAEDRAGVWGGGGAYVNGGRIENCTIVSNSVNNTGSANGGGGGLLINTSGTVVNTILYNNAFAGNGNNVTGSFALISFSCAPELTNGLAGNFTQEPGFVNTNLFDFQLVRGAYASEKGTNLDWTAIATDLAGNPRKRGKRVDAGCYETAPLSVGTLFVIR